MKTYTFEKYCDLIKNKTEEDTFEVILKSDFEEIKRDIFNKLVKKIEQDSLVKTSGDYSFQAGIDLCLQYIREIQFEKESDD